MVNSLNIKDLQYFVCVFSFGFVFNQIYSDNHIRCKVLFWNLILNFSTILCFSAECYNKVYSCPLFTGTIYDVGPTTVN